MPVAVLDLGSNIDKEDSLAKALEYLSDVITLRRCSPVYLSAPVGMANQPDYLNLSAEIETDLGVEELRVALRGIEDAMGRNRDVPKYGPRIIDIDILLYDSLVDDALGVPHPQTEAQTFVVLPLADLYPDGQHPKLGKGWTELRRDLLRGRLADTHIQVAREETFEALARRNAEWRLGLVAPTEAQVRRVVGSPERRLSILRNRELYNESVPKGAEVRLGSINQ